MNARDIGATIGALGELTKSGESLRAGARLTHVGAFGRIAVVHPCTDELAANRGPKVDPGN